MIQKKGRIFGARGAKKKRLEDALLAPLYLRASFAKGKTSTEPSAVPEPGYCKYPRRRLV
jgi:hypothetical protein